MESYTWQKNKKTIDIGNSMEWSPKDYAKGKIYWGK